MPQITHILRLPKTGANKNQRETTPIDVWIFFQALNSSSGVEGFLLLLLKNKA